MAAYVSLHNADLLLWYFSLPTYQKKKKKKEAFSYLSKKQIQIRFQK